MYFEYYAGVETQRVFYSPKPTDYQHLKTISEWTQREATRGTMVYRSPDDMGELAARGDSVLLIVDGVDAAHAARTHTYVRRSGPLGIVKRNIHEIGAVATEEGYQRNGFAKDVVLEAVRQQLTLRKRLQRRELLRPQVIAMVQVDNGQSNRFFSKLGTRLNPKEVPQEAFDTEAVGTGEAAHAYHTYDITNARRTRN